MRSLLVSLTLLTLTGTLAAEDSQPAGRDKTDIVETKGEYLGQKWRIDRRGVVFWNGKPYVRLTFTFAWEEKQVRLLAEHGIKQFALPVPEDLFQRDQRGVEEAVNQAERVASLAEELGGTYFAGLSNFLAPLHPDPGDELRYVERSVVEVKPADGQRDSLHAYVLRYRPRGRRLPGPWVMNVPDKMRFLRYTGRSQAYLFDLDRHSFRRIPSEKLSVRLLSAAQTPRAALGEVDGDQAGREAEGDEPEREEREELARREKGLAPCFEIELKDFSIPAGRRLTLVVLHEMAASRAVTDELGTLPAVWRPNVKEKFLSLVRRYRRAFRKPGLRAMDFGEEQHLLDISFVNPFDLYPDFRRDEIATGAYRRWLKRRFGEIGRLNRHLATEYRSFDEVKWQIPLTPLVLPDSVYQRIWRAELETIYDSGMIEQTFGVYRAVEAMARLDALQWEFRDWLYARYLAGLAREAQQVVGHVPALVASSDFDDHPLRRFRFHRMLMEEGMEGMIRNWYTVPVRGRGGFGAVPSQKHQDELPRLLQQAMGRSGKTKTLLANEIGYPQDRPGWPVFRSKQDLRSVLGVMGACGFRGFHLFSDPTSPEARDNVRWVAELQEEIAELMLSTAAAPPESPRRITDDQAIDRQRELQEFQRELKAMQEAGNQAEVREIQAIIKRLGTEAGTDDEPPQPPQTDDDRPKSKLLRSSGEYLGQKWSIDENHLMWWDGRPYVPFGGFAVKPGDKLGLGASNLWIDFDSAIGDPNYTRAGHKRDIARRLKEIAAAGGTCIVQFSMAVPHLPEGPQPGMRWKQPESGIDASRLTDPEVKRAIFKVWADYAPAVRNKCVRAIVLWNEINAWRWPERMPVDRYAEVLGEYVREAKRLVGDLPVCFKIAGTFNAEAVVAGAAVAGGLGFDVWLTSPNDAHARREIQRALRMLEARQKKTTWFFIAEGGRGIAEGGTDEAKDVKDYWDNWPPFRSKAEARGILRAVARAGAKGFIYNGPTSDPGSKYRDSYRWLGELKPEITRLMVETKRPAPERLRPATAARAIAAARADGQVQELLRGAESPRFSAEFSQRWHVWLVHFLAGDRPVGFASVSREGKVLEVGGPEEDDREDAEQRDDDEAARPLTFRFPLAARIHVPDAANTATLVTAKMVRKQPLRRRLMYQFVLVENEGEWTLISHRSAVPNDPFPSVGIRAAGDGLTLTLHDVKPQAVGRATFATMDEAIADYQQWLERTYRIGRIAMHPNKPAWLAKVKQVLTIDLWRPHGEITQDFADVTRFVDELHRAGVAEGVLLYLCGWSGPYDARYPEYQPAEELGGAEKFRQLVETAHRYGCRVMIHTCPVAFDPWLPSFGHFKDCALKGDDHPGGYRGWPGGYRSRELDFDSGKRTPGSKTATLRVPEKCEARLTVGGFGSARPTVTVRDRTLAVPPDAPDPYTLPFTFFFDKGEDQITFSSCPRRFWYRVHHARQFVHVWTYPFVGMDPKSAKWRDYFTRKVTAVVRQFKLDAVHLDAHAIGGSTWDCLPLFHQVMEALPGVAFSAEEGLGEVGLAVFGLTQGCWLGEAEMPPRSPLCAKLTEPYIRHFWHLVAARSFVPVGPVWNIDPPANVTDQDRKQLKRDLARAERLGVIRTVRINARKSRLDQRHGDQVGEDRPQFEDDSQITTQQAIAAAETDNRVSAWPVGLGKIVPPERGIYLGQTELKKGDIASLERAIGRSVAIAADLSVVTGQEEAGERNLSFDIRRARSYWDRGTVLLVGAYEAYPGHKPLTVDKLLRGEYDAELKRLASQLRAFGKPMFFSTAREPNGVLADYMGGFGPRGDKGVGWAERTGHGYDEFKPPPGPPGKPGLYAGLGDPRILDGIERLAAAQRYYHDFFVRRERLSFLTFDTMGWAVPTWQTDEKPVARFEDLYPLIADYCDWVSINFYMASEHEDEETGRAIPEPPLSHYLEALDAFMERVLRIAPDKPVLITELGFADPNRAEKIQRGLGAILKRHPQIKGIIGWGGDLAIRPDTPAGAAFRRIIDERPALFHSRVRFSQGGPGENADRKGEGGAVSDEGTITSPATEQRMEALKSELEKARIAGNQQDVSEILELLRDLRADHEVHGEVEDEVQRGGREAAGQAELEALERALEEARQQGNQQEQRKILERLLKMFCSRTFVRNRPGKHARRCPRNLLGRRRHLSGERVSPSWSETGTKGARSWPEGTTNRSRRLEMRGWRGTTIRSRPAAAGGASPRRCVRTLCGRLPRGGQGSRWRASTGFM